jgi:hypothetical protein
LGRSEIFQHYVSLCKAFPGLGTPTQAAHHYKHFPQEFLEGLTEEDSFSLDIMALSEHNRREKEEMDKAKEPKKEKKYTMKQSLARAKAIRESD